THWAVRGAPPSYHTPDEDVYLPGRNIILLGKAGVFCAVASLSRIVLGTLAHNPFPDATDEFPAALARALSLGLAHDIEIAAPFAGTSKADVTRRGLELGVDLTLTLSCMNPVLEQVHRVHRVHQVQKVRQAREPNAPSEPNEPIEPVHCGT